MANDRLAINSGADFIYPGFARYGLDYARVMTRWLFADPSNPFASQPERWADMATVRQRTGTLIFDGLDGSGRGTGLANNASQTLTFEFNGGRNYVIWSRAADAANYTGTPGSQNTGLINFASQLTDGTILDTTSPLTASFGSGEQPYVYVLPSLMLGTQRMQLTVTNRTGNANVFVYLSFGYYYLDLVGR